MALTWMVYIGLTERHTPTERHHHKGQHLPYNRYFNHILFACCVLLIIVAGAHIDFNRFLHFASSHTMFPISLIGMATLAEREQRDKEKEGE